MTGLEGDDLRWGVLGCECCAYPVIDGIPVMLANDDAREARTADARTRPAGEAGGSLSSHLPSDPARAIHGALPTRGTAAPADGGCARHTDPPPGRAPGDSARSAPCAALATACIF